MDFTGAAAALNRAPSTMMVTKSQSSLGVGNRIGSVSKVCVKPRSELSGGFRDVDHVLYYHTTATGRVRREKGMTTAMMVSCGGLVTEKDEKKTKKMKKKMKLLKGLTKDLSMLSSQAELVGEDDPNGISKATETLLQHLAELKCKEKELKKTRKMEKSMMKAAARGADCESSSSESSDSECGEVVDLMNLRLRSSIKPEALNGSSEVVSVLPPPSIPQQLENESCKLNFSNVEEPAVCKRIEVCMGGKCKKSGAAQLVEEFEKVVGEGAVVGCKCMGKCRDGPNVRVLSSGSDASDLGMMQASLSPPPLCVGVRLEDVGVIVSNFLGGGSSSSCGDHVSLAVAAATLDFRSGLVSNVTT